MSARVSLLLLGLAQVTAAPTTGTMTVTTKAVELKIVNVRATQELGGRQARSGYEFLIVDTSWKNIIAGPQSTPYGVPALTNFFWILTDSRYADTINMEVQNNAPNHLDDGFGLAKFGDTLRGTLAFEVPANAKFRAFQFFDVDNGSAYIPLRGTKPAAPAAAGAARENGLMQLAVAEAGFGPAGREAPSGSRYYTVTLRGQSKSPKDIINIPLQFVYAQNERGCIAAVESGVTELRRPFGDYAQFVPGAPNEGQMAFVVPDDTKSIRLLVTSTAQGQPPLVLPGGAEFTPTWPAPQTSLVDGSTMKIHVLPAPKRPAGLPAAGSGRELVVLDIVLENLKTTQGIDFQTPQQLRLMDGKAGFIEPMTVSYQQPCRIDDTGVVPAGQARRFTLVYDIPAGIPLKLQYRGFERDEAVLEIKR